MDVQNEDTVSAGASVSVPGHAGGVQLRYNYRLDPWPRHRAALGKAFGCARVVFNDGLRARREAREAGRPYITDAELSARLTAAKKTPERQWLGEVSAVVLQQALADLNAAYRNFFASLKGQRKSGRARHPRLRSRKDRRQAIRFTANARFKILPNGRLRLPKIGDVPVRWSRPLPGEPSSVTVIRDAAGRYFASFVVETDPAADAGRFGGAGREVGIDLGLAGYKAARYGRTFAKIGRFEPTSQVCSACGARDGPKPLGVRTWTCAACGTVHDRDVNAARNVLALGRRESLNACGGGVRPGETLATASETGSLRGAA